MCTKLSNVKVFQYFVILFTLQVGWFLPRCMECNAVLTMRFLSVCLSVRLSVRLSVKRVHCDKTEEKSVRIFIPCERPLCLLL